MLQRFWASENDGSGTSMLKLKTLLNLCLEGAILLIADESMDGAVRWNVRVIKLLDLLLTMLFGIVRTTGPWLRRLKSHGLILDRCGLAYRLFCRLEVDGHRELLLLQ